MDKKLLFVVNPCAGQRKVNKCIAEVVREFNDAGYRTEVYVTKAQGDATEYIHTHAKEFDRIVCAGGDGTLNETIAGLHASGTDIPIGYLPCGTTNDYASSIGLSVDLLEAAKTAVNGEIIQLDLGSFNGRSFTYTASCGIFTRASYATPQNLKNALGHLAYILEGIKELSTIRPIPMRITMGDKSEEYQSIFFAVTNSTSVAGILKLDSAKVDMNDGKFEVMVIRFPNTLAQLNQILAALQSMNLNSEMISFFEASELTIDLEKGIDWTLDGEHEDGAEHIEILNRHSAVRIVVPAKVEALSESEPEE